jgi:hypothetical protein
MRIRGDLIYLPDRDGNPRVVRPGGPRWDDWTKAVLELAALEQADLQSERVQTLAEGSGPTAGAGVPGFATLKD